MKTNAKPSNTIFSLSSQLQQQLVEDRVIDEILASSYQVSLKKGDRFDAEQSEAGLVYVRSGCTLEQLNLADDQQAASSVWTAGYTTVHLSSQQNRFVNGYSQFLCLFDAELTVVSLSALSRLCKQSPLLHDFLLRRANEYLYTSHHMALLRSVLGKRDNILLRLVIMETRTEGDTLHLTIDDLCQMTNTTRQYCGGVIKQLEKEGIVEKHYGHIHIRQRDQLKALLPPQALAFLSHYMSLAKRITDSLQRN